MGRRLRDKQRRGRSLLLVDQQPELILTVVSKLNAQEVHDILYRSKSSFWRQLDFKSALCFHQVFAILIDQQQLMGMLSRLGIFESKPNSYRHGGMGIGNLKRHNAVK